MTKIEQKINRLISLTQLHEEKLSYALVLSSILDIVHEISILEREKVSKKDILKILTIPKEILGKSFFFNHLQTWPRGYPGDFEMIEYIMNNENKCKKGSIEYYIEKYGLASTAAQQHRNKINEQAHRILAKYIKNKSGKIRILSIASGSSPDVRMIQQYLEPHKIEFVLLDSDEDAIEYSLGKLSSLKESIQTIRGNIFRSLIRLQEYGEFDLIMIGGLFDYFKDNLIVKILNNIYINNLKPEGSLFFTNIGSDNIDRVPMEYLGDWSLISRNQQELISLCKDAGISNNEVKVSMENSKVAFLVDILKNRM